MTTITLEGKEYQFNIEQAEKLGLLKEKSDRVKSWEEFKKKYSNMLLCCTASQLTSKETLALDSFSKLLKLRRDWIGEWEPDWTNDTTCKFVIGYGDRDIKVNVRNISARSLSFPTEQMAREFLETFRDLIKEAKILI